MANFPRRLTAICAAATWVVISLPGARAAAAVPRPYAEDGGAKRTVQELGAGWVKVTDTRGRQHLEYTRSLETGTLTFRVYREASGYRSTVTVSDRGVSEVYEQVVRFLPKGRMRVLAFDPQGKLAYSATLETAAAGCGDEACAAFDTLAFAYCSATREPRSCALVTGASFLLCGFVHFVCDIPPPPPPCSALDGAFQGEVQVVPNIGGEGDRVTVAGILLRGGAGYTIHLYPNSETHDGVVLNLSGGTTDAAGTFRNNVTVPNFPEASKGTMGIFCVQYLVVGNERAMGANWIWND